MTRDFREFLQSLNDHGVDYLVIGGHAVAYHGYPRATADLDVWVAVHPWSGTPEVRKLGVHPVAAGGPGGLRRGQ